MRRTALVLVAVCGALLAGCSAAPAPLRAVSTVPAERVRETMQPGNPWAQLSNGEIGKRARIICDGLDDLGVKFFRDQADHNETTSPKPYETTPDLDRAQTLDAVKATVVEYCPAKVTRLDW